VLDFGLARVAGTSRLTKEGVVFGTPQYMSPEQAAGELVDHRSDIYGLGVMMYEMLTGRVPFEADTYMGVLTKHLRTPPVPPRVVLGERDLGGLEPIVLRALEKSPARRFSNMTELMMALDQRGAARVERRPAVGWGERPVVGPVVGTSELISTELLSTELLQVAGLPKRLAWPRLGQVPRWLVPAALGAAVACVTMAWVLHERPGDPPTHGSEVIRVTTSTAEGPPSGLAPAALAPAAPVEFSGGQPVATSQSAPQAVTPTAVAVAPAAERPSDPGPEKPVQPAPAKVIRPTAARETAKMEAPKPAPTVPKRRSHVAGDIIDPWAETP
jgi:serine/threonine-protein kinase